MVLVGVAHADGAFPDSFALFAPSDQAGTLRLATNFGLVFSTDGAQTWHYVCEQAVITFASLYAEGPDDALYAVSRLGLVSSRDGGCTWTTARGALAMSAADDVFADPSDAMHVLAIAEVLQDGGTLAATQLFESRDGGLTFGGPLYTPAPQRTLTGIEIARSDANTMYLTMYDPGPHPWLAKSSDGGAHFSEIDLGGADFPRLIAIDPQNPQRIFLRLGGRDGDVLGISTDGGATVLRPLTVPGKMSAFLLRPDGTILVGGTSGAWRSTDGGMSFSDWPVGLHLRGLAERAGLLYLVGDDKLDKAALFTSPDEMTLTPILRFRDILGPAGCGNVPQACDVPWMQLQPLINPDYDGGVPDLSMSPTVSDGGCGLAPGGVGLLPVVCILLLACRRRRDGVRNRA
jgi:hypothetical protein